MSADIDVYDLDNAEPSAIMRLARWLGVEPTQRDDDSDRAHLSHCKHAILRELKRLKRLPKAPKGAWTI